MIFLTILLSVIGLAAGVGALIVRGASDAPAGLARKLGIASAIVLVAAYLSTSVVAVDVGQVGVITRFGAITGRELSPGITTKAPFPIEKVVTFNTQVQKDEVDATAASQDLQDVQSKLAVNYHLERGKVSDIYQGVGINYADRVIAPAIQESFKATTANYTAENLIKKRSEVAQAAKTNLSERLEKYGISVDSVNIINLTFSAAFSQAIEQSQVAAQQVVKANNEVERVKKEAEAAIEKARGEAEAQREQAQSITPEYLELKKIETQAQAIARWNGILPTTTGGDGMLFSLPVGR